MKNHKSTLLLLANVLISLQGISQTQTVRGMVSDASSGLPLPGALVFLEKMGAGETFAATTDSLGRYRMEKVPVGRQTIQASFLGYEKLLLPGLLIEAGKEFILDIGLREKPSELDEVVVTASAETPSPHPLGVYSLKVEEQFRYPATYYDPARLAMSLPGVAGADDQGNSISVRGSAPASVRWRLEGADIVNPNHTANAGTFSDRPTAAGGGVNILSAQLLGTSNFLAGAFPSGYGNALGGILDMYLRNGNDEQQEFTAQASVIGLEAAAEGPLKKSQTTNYGKRPGSYLANYRYSFVGLLTAAGADFGGEEIAFQDLSFRFHFPVWKNAELGFFGMGGQSRNVFNSPSEADEIKEEKDLFNIRFQSKMGAAGLTLKTPIGHKTRLHAAVVYSGLRHERASEKTASTTQPVRWSDDDVDEAKLVFWGKILYKKNARQNWEIGLQASGEQAGFQYFFTDNLGQYQQSGNMSGWLIQPYSNAHIYLSKKIKTEAGLHLHHFTETPANTVVLPRIALTYFSKKNQQIIIAFGEYAQLQHPIIHASETVPNVELGATRSRQTTAAFQHIFEQGFLIKTEIYHQYLYDVPVSARSGSTYSVLNNVELFSPVPDTFATTGKGRNYGLDLLLEKPISSHAFARLGGSLYRSFFTDHADVERPSRFDGRYLMNLSLGREKARQKKEKTVIRGQSARFSWYGGFRQTPVDEAKSALIGRTVFDETNANTLKLNDYYRLDLRFYWKWNKPNRSSTFSLDLQNATNRKNQAYLFYDQVQQRVRTKQQLGLIPLIAYRMEFG